MADSVATPTPSTSLPTGKAGGEFYRSIGTITISAGDYATGGIALNLLQSGIKAQRVPLVMEVSGIAGFTYAYVNGTDASNGLLKIFVQDAVAQDPLVELTDESAMPAGVLADTISYDAKWLGME